MALRARVGVPARQEENGGAGADGAAMRRLDRGRARGSPSSAPRARGRRVLHDRIV